MRRRLISGLLFVCATASIADAGDQAPVHHDLQVVIDPAEHSLQVVDGVTLSNLVEPDCGGGYRFVLHAGLEPEVISPDWRLERLEAPVTATAGPPGVGLPLTGEAAEEFLASAEVVKLKNFDTKGITEPRKATLSDGQQTYNAVFKDIDIIHPKMKLTTGKTLLNLYDSYKHEIAAYELDKLMGLGLVPPCVERTIKNATGSLCMWVEGSMTQADSKNKNLHPPNYMAYNDQMHDIKLFLHLVWDSDYNNIANILIDENWKLYKVDSSRSFRADSNLRRPETLTRFRCSSVDALKKLNLEELTAAMKPWLSPKAISALWERRNRLLEIIQQKQKEPGASFYGINATTDFFGINATTESVSEQVPLETWRLVPHGDAQQPVVLKFGGVIHHELAQSGEEYQRSFSETPGLIEERGIFLAGASFWVPTFGENLVTFELEVTGLTPPWDVVSQGERIHHRIEEDQTRTTVWKLDRPTEEIYLVAGPWHEYSDQAGDVEIFAFLRDDDPSLADKYLDATKRYLKLYESMLPPYPYWSFALVENFWETGYGMPGFTLLGPRIIRFPWILTSSYPHELLHNWWGNAAYVDFDHGNWCEGLTAYMADHLFAEQRGEAAIYRRATLKKYSDFVSSGNDFPLSDFSSRRSAASEAVGYGKSLMLFHMVRRAVGDEAFLEAMSSFYENHSFQRASFGDIADAMEASDGGDWPELFAQWTGRTGAPTLAIEEIQVAPTDDAELPWNVTLHLRQIQSEEPFTFTVPVAVTVEGRDEALVVEAGSCHRDCKVEVACPGRPLRVDVDPSFDVMRRLDPLEVPPALSTIFGTEAPLFVLPAAASEDERSAWTELATGWAKPHQARIVLDVDLERMPEETAWILGWDNRWAGTIVERVAVQGVDIGDDELRLVDKEIPRADHSLVLVARSAEDPTAALGLVTADPVGAIPGLTRKLPHYTRYSYLGFKGDEPENVVKGMWQPVSSPLVRNLTDGDLPALVLPVRPPMAELPAVFDAAALKAAVTHLADPGLEGRGLGSEGLAAATDWVEARFREIGLEPAGDAGYRQVWTETAGDPARAMELTNLVGMLSGSESSVAEQPVVVLAHLDHLGTGWPDVRAGNEDTIHPGADDNASGVAVLLELAKAMAGEPSRPRPVLFAVVTGEEAGRIGSRRFMKGLKQAQAPFACVNLDSVGRLSDGKLFVLNADTASEWRYIFMGVGYTTGAPVAVVTEPLDSSDQMSCIEVGVPAVQLFTGPHADYHRPSDTANTVDADGMAVVAEAAHEAVGYLAERLEPITVTTEGQQPAAVATPENSSARRANLGTMPDFAFSGPGVKVQQVMPGSAAENAGILAGDVVLALDGKEIADLRGFSTLLKSHAPGDRVTVTILRDGANLELEATLGER